MKRAKLEEILRRKIRLKITRVKRGKVALVMCVNGNAIQSEQMPNKRHALTALHTRLRCMPEITIEIWPIKKFPKGGAS